MSATEELLTELLDERERIIGKKDARIRELEAALELERADALFMASVWTMYAHAFGFIVDNSGGDSDGVDFVAYRIIDHKVQP